METFGDRLRPAPADILLQEMADEASVKARYVNEVFISGEKFSVGDKVKVEKIECIDFLPRVIVAEISSIFVVGEEKVSRCTIYTCWHPYYKSFDLGKDRILKFEKVEGEVEETRRLVARKGYEEIVRLYKYLHKVIKDSYEAERRPYREPREFLVLIAGGKVTLLIDAGDYARVGRRAIYRLERNLFKNFPFLKGKIDSFNMVEDTCGKRIKLEDYIRFEIFKMHEGYSYKDCISLDQIKLNEG